MHTCQKQVIENSEGDIAVVYQFYSLSNVISIQLGMLRPVNKVVELRLQSRTVQIRASHANKGAGEATMSRVTTAFVNGSGHVKLSNGDTWTSRSAGSAEDLPLGDTVVVVAIEGATAVVAPLERNAL